MKQRFLVAFVLVLQGFAFSPASSAELSIVKIYDGDTITLSTGEKVRLLQIDTPELAQGECYAAQARTALVNLLNSKGRLVFRRDSRLEDVDQYGRLLRYIFKGKINVSLKMVQTGAAAPYFYRGERGAFSQSILTAAIQAKENKIGLWKTCSATKLRPNSPVQTIVERTSMTLFPTAKRNGCDSNYADCIPVYPPDLDCTDIKRLGLAPVRVTGIDVHKLDRDGNGIGCA